MRLSYTPVVNVKVVRPGKQGLKKAVLETAKYPVKPLNFKKSEMMKLSVLFLRYIMR